MGRRIHITKQLVDEEQRRTAQPPGMSVEGALAAFEAACVRYGYSGGDADDYGPVSESHNDLDEALRAALAERDELIAGLRETLEGRDANIYDLRAEYEQSLERDGERHMKVWSACAELLHGTGEPPDVVHARVRQILIDTAPSDEARDSVEILP